MTCLDSRYFVGCVGVCGSREQGRFAEPSPPPHSPLPRFPHHPRTPLSYNTQKSASGTPLENTTKPLFQCRALVDWWCDMIGALRLLGNLHSRRGRLSHWHASQTWPRQGAQWHQRSHAC